MANYRTPLATQVEFLKFLSINPIRISHLSRKLHVNTDQTKHMGDVLTKIELVEFIEFDDFKSDMAQCKNLPKNKAKGYVITEKGKSSIDILEKASRILLGK